jgi:uncharacterized coiled-coil protein SlyX
MAGHKLDKTTQAYWQTRAETELVELFAKHYHALRVLKSTIDEAKVKELESKVYKREDVIDALVQNGKNKDEKIAELETKLNKLEEGLKVYDNALQDIREMEKELKELHEGGATVYYMDDKAKETLRQLVREELEKRNQ